jgi:hypothetical protein
MSRLLVVKDSATTTTAIDPWDALTDPHEEHLQNGREEGKQTGLETGFKMGYDLGRTTAIDVGMELGFIRGAMSTIGSSNEISDRAQKTIRELNQLIDTFPGVDEMFREQEQERLLGQSASDENNDVVEEEDSEETHRTTGTRTPNEGAVNIRTEIQRIRAKFKLLTVQIGCPHFSLKQVMDTAAEEETVIDTTSASDAIDDAKESGNNTSEW